MHRIHVIGGKNHGKTQLVVELIEEFVGRGLRVGTIKHTHHHHELDVPGKDSHRHRAAGAALVGILSPNMTALFIDTGKRRRPGEDRYAALERNFADCDLLLVEGDSQTSAAKIEVWRAELQTEPLAARDPSILAVVTDDPLDFSTTVRPRSELSQLADWLLRITADASE